jgi:hypothetical protein
LNFGFQIIFIDQEPEGENCKICKQEIKGKKWVMMLDFGDPVNFPPEPLDTVICVTCKLKMEKDEK